MKNDDNLISVNILNREYTVKCNPHEVSSLQESASYLNEQMQKMKKNSKLNSGDQIAVITALNIAHELISLKNQQTNSIQNMSDRIHNLQNKIEIFLAEEQEVTV